MTFYKFYRMHEGSYLIKKDRSFFVMKKGELVKIATSRQEVNYYNELVKDMLYDPIIDFATLKIVCKLYEEEVKAIESADSEAYYRVSGKLSKILKDSLSEFMNKASM